MESFFVWLEATPLSTWLRESPSLWAFPFVLILHTVGLAFFVGANVVAQIGLGLSVALFFSQRFPGAHFLRGLLLAAWMLPEAV